MNDFIVYKHRTSDTNQVFYIGEGRPKRAFSRDNRNRYWHFKVNKHGGDFRVEIIAHGLSKAEAEAMETRLIIEARDSGINLVNFCTGPMFSSHWLANAPKEAHPMYGKKRSNPGVAESNRRRLGTKTKPRPDLAERNRRMRGEINHYKRPVRCVETGEVFESLTTAGASIGRDNSKVHRAIHTGMRTGGFHWEYIDSER